MKTSELSVLRMAITQAWNAVVITNADATQGYPVELANPAFCQMTGYTLEELLGTSLKKLQGPDTDPAVVERMRTCLREARYFDGMTTNYRKDGTPYIVHWNISPVRNDAGVLTHFVSVQQDMTEFVRAGQRGRMLAQALDATSDPVLLTDVFANIVFVNAAFLALTGYDAHELLGKTPKLLQSGEHDAAFYQGLRKALAQGQDFKAHFINRRRDGSLFHLEQNISPLRDETGKITHYISVGRDITERLAHEKALKKAADYDKLTGLYNRHRGETLLSEMHLNAQMLNQPLSLIACDIDHFKRINDRFGHPVGDRVLRDIAHVLRQTVRGSDPVMRWGGEEFVIALPQCNAAQSAELAERIRIQVERHHDEEVGQITLSLGVAQLQAHESMDALLKRADQALYSSKHDGRNRLTVA